MSSWKKSYHTVKIVSRETEKGSSGNSDMNNHESWLPQYYHGSNDRMSRYAQYDYMDFDVDVNMALDKTAEFCTLIDESTGLPFILDVSSEVTGAEVQVLQQTLRRWCRINDWNGRLFELFRGTLKYGDQVTIRDPDTFKLLWVDMYNVSRILVDEENGKTPEYMFIKNLDFNLIDKVASVSDDFATMVGSNSLFKGASQYSFEEKSYKAFNFQQQEEEYPVSYSHIVHVSRSQGMDSLWPFGKSILDPVFKPFRQKELMEEAIIIYRVQRSPERLVFKIDTGDMNEKKATAYINRVKEQYKQKRIPVIDRSNGETIMDTTYSPLTMTEDFFFAQGMDGRGSTVEQLPGGDSTGSIEDLKFFATRLVRALRVPVSYMSYLTDDGNSYNYNDGKTGTAYIEEFSYSEYCKRLQRQIIKSLNREFKMFVKSSDISINSSEYDISFVPPQSFSEYRQIELDTAQLSVFQGIADVSYLSKRFKMSRFLGLSDAEIRENERLWKEENKVKLNLRPANLTDVGVSIVGERELDEMEEDENEVMSSFDDDNDALDDDFGFEDEGEE